MVGRTSACSSLIHTDVKGSFATTASLAPSGKLLFHGFIHLFVERSHENGKSLTVSVGGGHSTPEDEPSLITLLSPVVGASQISAKRWLIYRGFDTSVDRFLGEKKMG